MFYRLRYTQYGVRYGPIEEHWSSRLSIGSDIPPAAYLSWSLIAVSRSPPDSFLHSWLLDERLNDKTLWPRPTWSYLDDSRRWEQRLLLINHRGRARLRQDEKVSESSKRFHLLLSLFITFVVQSLVTPPRLHIPHSSHYFVCPAILLSFIIPFLSSTRSFYFLHFVFHCRIRCSFVVSGVLLISLHLNFSSLHIATVTGHAFFPVQRVSSSLELVFVGEEGKS